MAMVNLSERNHSYIPSNGDQSLSFGNESIISKPISSREPIMRKASSKDNILPSIQYVLVLNQEIEV